jgi:hypothetical protein
MVSGGGTLDNALFSFINAKGQRIFYREIMEFMEVFKKIISMFSMISL